MSTLADLITEALKGEGLADGGNPHGWRCEHPDRFPGYCTCPRDIAEVVAAVVADWLERDDTIRAAEDAHPERGGSCCFNMGQPGHHCPPYVTSASMSAALAAEARKGADQ